MSRMKPRDPRSDDNADAHPVREKTHSLYKTTKPHISTIGFAAFAAVTAMTAPVSAQAGSGICGTPLADTINQGAPLIVGVLMIGGAMLAYILHNASAFFKRTQTVQEVKDWRNRAAFASITTPLFALVMELFIGFTGADLATCVDLVPFI